MVIRHHPVTVTRRAEAGCRTASPDEEDTLSTTDQPVQMSLNLAEGPFCRFHRRSAGISQWELATIQCSISQPFSLTRLTSPPY